MGRAFCWTISLCGQVKELYIWAKVDTYIFKFDKSIFDRYSLILDGSIDIDLRKKHWELLEILNLLNISCPGA